MQGSGFQAHPGREKGRKEGSGHAAVSFAASLGIGSIYALDCRCLSYGQLAQCGAMGTQ